MTINFVSVVDNPHWTVPTEGTYLVRVTRKIKGTNYVSNKYFDTIVNRKFDSSKNIWHNTFGCSGTVTHISSQPIK